MKKKILVPYASYGNGHKAIAQYIKDYFEKNCPNYEIMTLDLLSFCLPIIGKISQKVSHFLMFKHPIMWSAVYSFFDNKYSGSVPNKISMTMFKNKRLRNTIRDFNPDLTISTHFFSSSLIAYYKKKGICHSKLITVVTDHNAHEFWLQNIKVEDALIVSNKEEGNNLINKGFDKKKVKDFGIPIAPMIPTNFNKQKLLKKYHFSNKRLICLFFAGGGHGANAVIPYIRRVLKAKLNINILFISGQSKTLKEKVERLAKQYNADNIRVFGFVNNVPELMQISDFVITKPGGAQTTEALYFKKPTLLINGNGGQERGNARYLVKNGYGKRFRSSYTFCRYIKELSTNPWALDEMHNKINTNNSNMAMKKLFDLANDILKSKY